jgi:hypothetical protein
MTIRPRERVELPSVRDGGGFRFAPGYRSRGFAAATERGPLGTHMDSRFRENDTGTPRERGPGCLRHELDEPSSYATSLRCVPPIGACRGGGTPLRFFCPPRVGGRLRPRQRRCGRTLPGLGVFSGLGTNHSEEGEGTRPCRGFGGVPQLPSVYPQEWGQGLKYHS